MKPEQLVNYLKRDQLILVQGCGGTLVEGYCISIDSTNLKIKLSQTELSKLFYPTIEEKLVFKIDGIVAINRIIVDAIEWVETSYLEPIKEKLGELK